MKQTLLTLCLLFAFGTVRAQNDATWDETIAFIEKYKGFIISNVNKCDAPVKTLNISDGKMSFSDDNYSYEVDLEELNRVKLERVWEKTNTPTILLNLTGPYFQMTSHDGRDIRNLEGGGIDICGEEMRERMFNAFSHLAKLATEKREAERKDSGDKF